jgi:hypothetical protein
MIRKVSLVVAIALLMAAAASAQKGRVNLFDGKTLKGWSVHSGTATYKVEKGVIVGTAVLGSPNSFLCTDKEFGDFILKFEVKVDAELNSGVQIRSEISKEARVFKATTPAGKEVERKTPPDRVYGYQVEIADGTGNAGNIYDEARRARFLDDWTNKPEAKKAFKSGKWNKFRVEARGDSIKTWVNGIACADIHDSMTARGIIGLQVHQVPKDKFKPYRVRFRNLRIQELK